MRFYDNHVADPPIRARLLKIRPRCMYGSISYGAFAECVTRNRAAQWRNSLRPLYCELRILNIASPETTHISAQQARYSVSMICFARTICALGNSRCRNVFAFNEDALLLKNSVAVGGPFAIPNSLEELYGAKGLSGRNFRVFGMPPL